MHMRRHLFRWIFTVSVVLIVGCVVIPIPALQDSVVSGRAIAESEVRSMVSNGEDAGNVRTRLGSPTIDFGPRRVYGQHSSMYAPFMVDCCANPPYTAQFNRRTVVHRIN